MDAIKREENAFSEDEVIEAMRELPGYIDLTPHDFRLLYEKVYELAKRRLMSGTKARDIMTSPAVVVHASDTVRQLAALLDGAGVSGVPVVDAAGKPLGVVSEKDVLRAMGEKPTAGLMRLATRAFAENPAASPEAGLLAVEKIMSAPALSVSEEASLTEIARLFEEKAINRTPVLGPDGTVTGIITRSNVIGALCGGGAR